MVPANNPASGQPDNAGQFSAADAALVRGGSTARCNRNIWKTVETEDCLEESRHDQADQDLEGEQIRHFTFRPCLFRNSGFRPSSSCPNAPIWSRSTRRLTS